AEVHFNLAGAATAYQVLVVSHTPDGRLGSNRLELRVRPALRLEPHLPAEVTWGDLLDIPVDVASALPRPATVKLEAQVRNVRLLDGDERTLALKAAEQRQALFKAQAALEDGGASLRLLGQLTAGAGRSVTHSLRVAPDGFPVSRTHNGALKTGELI